MKRPVWQRFEADLHIHTALSPCGGDEMTPPAIVQTAVERGLDLIAVCDHNSARNAAAVQEAARRRVPGRLCVLAGMEITSAEEAHVLGLFPTAHAAENAGTELGRLLGDADATYSAFWGEQHLLDADGDPLGSETRALALATPLELGAAVSLIHNHGGLALAAHVDRPAFGVISQLGFFPLSAGFDGVEISRHLQDDSPRLAEIALLGLPVTSASDAHYLDEIGCARTVVQAGAPTFDELAAALRGSDGRSVARA